MLNLDNSSDNFFVQSRNDDNAEFLNRQKSVFEKLDAVVKDTEKSVDRQKRKNVLHIAEETKPYKKQRYDTRQFRGQESIFKRPEAPPPARIKRTGVPDYIRHPENWTKYTLSDVSPDDMSDRSNTAAAMTFLRELKAKKESESMDVDNETKQITFKKPLGYKKRENDSDNTAKFECTSFRSSKVILPEYVVGEKKVLKKNITPKLTTKMEKTKEIKLDHLNDEEDQF